MINSFPQITGWVFFVIIGFGAASCRNEPKVDNVTAQTKRELAVIDSLLKSESFAFSMAKALDSAYYVGIDEPVPDFLLPGDETTLQQKKNIDQRIATSLAGFYALECGLGTLSSKTKEPPVSLLQKINAGSVDSNTVLLLNRYANATWKASQPFRGLNRITRYNFIGAQGLSKEEVDKDYIQIRNAATKLLSSLQSVQTAPLEQQMQLLRQLLQDTAYAVQMASYLDSSYSVSQNTPFTPFNRADTTTVSFTVKELKIATSIAGFYAVECVVNYLVTTRHQPPSVILKAFVHDTQSKEDRELFTRFANATWKAGQPFRGLTRISRATFTPFYFLGPADVDKDIVQLKTAAQRLLMFL